MSDEARNAREDVTPLHPEGTRRRGDNAARDGVLHAKVDTLAREVFGIKRRMRLLEAKLAGAGLLVVTVAELLRYLAEQRGGH